MDEKDALLKEFEAFPLSDLDRQILSMKDEDFHVTQWHELRDIVCISLLIHLFPFLLLTNKSLQQA